MNGSVDFVEGGGHYREIAGKSTADSSHFSLSCPGQYITIPETPLTSIIVFAQPVSQCSPSYRIHVKGSRERLGRANQTNRDTDHTKVSFCINFSETRARRKMGKFAFRLNCSLPVLSLPVHHCTKAASPTQVAPRYSFAVLVLLRVEQQVYGQRGPPALQRHLPNVRALQLGVPGRPTRADEDHHRHTRTIVYCFTAPISVRTVISRRAISSSSPSANTRLS